MQFDVKQKVYWFDSAPSVKHSFLNGALTTNDGRPVPHLYFFSATGPDTFFLQNPCGDDVWVSDVSFLPDPCGEDRWASALEDVQLEEAGKSRLRELLTANEDVCTTQLGRTQVLAHKLFLTQEMPLKQKPYRASPPKLQAMKELIDVMLEQDIIEPSSSAWAAPVVMIPKKTGGMRFCVDYRKLNAVSHTDAYPLPTVQEILESLAGAAVFTTLDLNSGYWQVQMDQASQDKTAFVCKHGLFQFKVMPFGLKNAPATFQRLMERILVELCGRICFVYLDDIIIHSASLTQHFEDIQAVLDALRSANLTVNMKKSHFFCSSLKFLGHVVSSAGVEVDPEKTQAIRDFPVPRNLKEVQRFLGMAGWYHRYVPNFSALAEPLNALKRKGVQFSWSPECQRSFEALKYCLISSPILGHPDFTLPFVVYTDASDVGLGAVLAQKTGLGTEEVLAFASRSLNSAERNYSTTEQECLAVVWSLEKWRHYLEGRAFTVVTDHSSLVWVFKTPKPSSRLIRWALRLQEFTFTVEYRKGKYNTVPDALSRAPVDLPDMSLPLGATIMAVSPQRDPGRTLTVSDEEIWRAQQADPEVQKLYETITDTGEVEVNATTKFTILEDKVYRVVQLAHKTLYQVYVPLGLRSQLLETFHEDPLAGHMGRFKTYKRLQALAYWPKLSLDVKQHVRCCQVCQRNKPESRKPAGLLQQTIVHRPWEMLGVDLMGPFPRSTKGHVYLLVFVDYYSRWVELFALRQATAETVSKVLTEEILTRWGVPDYILSDQGSQFVSSVFEATCQQWNVAQKRTTAYHPQTNMTERINRNLKAMIASYVGDHHKHWDQHLPEFRFALNSAVHESTGVTPAEVNLRRPLRGPMEVLLQPRDCTPDSQAYRKAGQLSNLRGYVTGKLEHARGKQKRQYDKGRREVEYVAQDRVWMRTHPYSKANRSFSAKLAPRWKGPYRVLRRMGPLTYEIVLEETSRDVRVVNVTRLKPCYPSAAEVAQEEERRQLEDMFEDGSEESTFLGFQSSGPRSQTSEPDEEEERRQLEDMSADRSDFPSPGPQYTSTPSAGSSHQPTTSGFLQGEGSVTPQPPL